MITENDLKQAIAECQGERNPNANTCVKLAAYYTIQAHMYGKPKDGLSKNMQSGASFAARPEPSEAIESEFMRAVRGNDTETVLVVMDDLMQALQVLSPRLYRLTMRKLQ